MDTAKPTRSAEGIARTCSTCAHRLNPGEDFPCSECSAIRNGNQFLWVAPIPTAEAKELTAEQVDAMDDTAGITPEQRGSKPSNPKDALGIRKAPMSTVSAAVLAEVGVAMLEGASKYGRHNYRAVGVRSSVYYDATMRHLMDWWEGVDIDPDSNMHHITKAITSLVVLRDAMIQGMVTDDRPPRSQPFFPRLNEKAGEIVDKHAEKRPRHYTIKDTDWIAEQVQAEYLAGERR